MKKKKKKKKKTGRARKNFWRSLRFVSATETLLRRVDRLYLICQMARSRSNVESPCLSLREIHVEIPYTFNFHVSQIQISKSTQNRCVDFCTISKTRRSSCDEARCGDVAQLVEHRTGTPMTQVGFPAAARDWSPRVNFWCRLSFDACLFVRWCFEPSQHLGITSGLSLTVSVHPCVQSHALTSVRTLKFLWKH